MQHTTSIFRGKVRHTLSDGAATAHNFETRELAAKSMRHHALHSKDRTLESQIVDLSDMLFCSVVPKFEEAVDQNGEDFLRPAGLTLEPRK